MDPLLPIRLIMVAMSPSDSARAILPSTRSDTNSSASSVVSAAGNTSTSIAAMPSAPSWSVATTETVTMLERAVVPCGSVVFTKFCSVGSSEILPAFVEKPEDTTTSLVWSRSKPKS